MTTEELIKAIRSYALEHYNEGGWDYIVEAWEDSDIVEAIEGATSLEVSIVNLQPTMSALASRDREEEAMRSW